MRKVPAPTSVRSLKVAEWPAADQRSWAEACRPGGRLTRGGRASHLRPVSRDDLTRRYGMFLDFLARTCRLKGTNACSSLLITPENVAAYLEEIGGRLSSVSVQGAIAKLRRMGDLLDPSWDSSWLRVIEQDLAIETRPAPKQHRIVDSDLLVAAGELLMRTAEEDTSLPPGRRANRFRNGLMIALLAFCPIRLKNLAVLELGVTIRKVGDAWVITLSADDTKGKKPDERMVPDYLAPAVDRYISHFRKPGCDTPALWIGRTGQPLSYSSVGRAVYSATAAELGIPISPHLFRSCGASFAYRHASDRPGLAAAILHHTGSRVTEKHYNRAKSVSFAAEFLRIVEDK